MNPVEQAQKEALDKYTRQQAKFAELQNEITAGQKLSPFSREPIADDKRKEILDKYASEIGLSSEFTQELKQIYDDLRRSGLSGAQAGRTLVDSMKLNQQDLGKLQQLGTFMDQGTANKIAALQRLSGKEVQDFGEIGGYKEGYTTSDTSLLKQFADIRAQGQSEFSQSVRMSEIYNNSKNIRKNALDGNQENRDFFISMNPKLGTLYAELEKIKSDYKNLPKTSGYLVGSRGYNKQMEEYEELINKYEKYIDKIQGEVINSLPDRIKALNESSMKKLKMSTLQDFKDNYNSGPKIKY
jgi:predicted hydrocarbon binding protein